jgi:hypothetical protein
MAMIMRTRAGKPNPAKSNFERFCRIADRVNVFMVKGVLTLGKRVGVWISQHDEARPVPKVSTPPFMATPKGFDFWPNLVRKLLNPYPSSFRRQKNAAEVFPFEPVYSPMKCQANDHHANRTQSPSRYQPKN